MHTAFTARALLFRFACADREWILFPFFSRPTDTSLRRLLLGHSLQRTMEQPLQPLDCLLLFLFPLETLDVENGGGAAAYPEKEFRARFIRELEWRSVLARFVCKKYSANRYSVVSSDREVY